MLAEIARKVRRRESFAFETTLSGLNYTRHIPLWQQSGYHVKPVFLSLPSADLAVVRVKGRAAQGGHEERTDGQPQPRRQGRPEETGQTRRRAEVKGKDAGGTTATRSTGHGAPGTDDRS